MTDNELIRKIATGDDRAFKALFDRHSGKVFGYAKRAAGESVKPEDVSLDIWMKVIADASTPQGIDFLKEHEVENTSPSVSREHRDFVLRMASDPLRQNSLQAKPRKFRRPFLNALFGAMLGVGAAFIFWFVRNHVK